MAYNTTPMWQDPNNPPSPGDPYWADWIAVNPGYNRGTPGEATPPPAPGPTNTTPPPTTTAPAPAAPSGLTYDQVLAQAQQYYQSKWGVALSPDVVAQIKGELGFSEGGLIQPSALGSVQSWIDGHQPAGGTAQPSVPGGGSDPGTGYGAAPPLYASNPNAPQYTPMAPYVAPKWEGGDFVNPTQADVEATPGYQTRLTAGLQARNRAAAAQGTVLSGGTLKALDRFGQEYAQNEYQTTRGNALENYKAKYGQFQDAAGMSLASRTLNANENNQTYANRTASYLTDNTRTLNDYLTNVSTKRNTELDYWNRLKDLYAGGQSTAAGSYK